MVGKPKMQNPLGWEVGTEREAGRDYWLQFGGFFLQMNFFFKFFLSEAFIEGIFG